MVPKAVKMLRKLLLLVVLVLVVTTIDAREVSRTNVDFESNEVDTTKAKPGGSIWRRKRTTEVADDEDSSKSTHLSSTEAQEMLKFFTKIAWEENKEALLSGFIDEIADSDTNITVIGWQHLYNDDGSVKEVTTIEFVIPPKPDTDGVGNFEIDDTELENVEEAQLDDLLVPHTRINALREVLEPFKTVGIPSAITYQAFDEKGKETSKMFVDHDEVYINADGFKIYNKTLVDATPEDIRISSERAQKYKGHCIFKFDEHFNFKGKDNVDPLFVANVVDSEDVSNDILLAAPGIAAEVGITHQWNEVPKGLALKFNEEFPRYKWRTIVDPDNFMVTKDISITLALDTFGFYEDTTAKFVVYGEKK